MPVPKYELGQKPIHLLTGLSDTDKDVLFGALAHASTALKYDPDAPEDVRNTKVQRVMQDQEKQEEMMARILDLRNASKSQIHAFNRKRIVQEFGAGWNAGDTVVQCKLPCPPRSGGVDG